MDTPSTASAQPAVLMRRMTAPADPTITRLSRNAADPMLRFNVEMSRGSVRIELAESDEASSIQWTQNGRPIQGQTESSLSLAGLSPDDGDVYYALLRTGSVETRSQSFLLVVVPGHPLLNYSARGWVMPGKPLIAGFVVGRAAGLIKNKRYLVRAIGLSLQRFGVTEVLSHPLATLHRRNAHCQELLQADVDGSLAREWAPKVGAFALPSGHTEFVAVAELPPGPYSLVVTGAEGETGEALIELYEIPG